MSRLLSVISTLLDKIKIYRYNYKMKCLFDRGLHVGKNVTIQPEAIIDEKFPYLISIGNNCTIADNVRVIAHDESLVNYLDGYMRIGKVEIKDNCFIATHSYISPGVTIGPNALVAAGSYVDKDVPPNSCVIGVPARVYSEFDQFIEGHKEKLKVRAVHNYADINPGYRSLDIEKEVLESVKDGDAYVQGLVGRYPFSHNKD